MPQCERSNDMLKSWVNQPLRRNVVFGGYRTSSGRGMKGLVVALSCLFPPRMVFLGHCSHFVSVLGLPRAVIFAER